MGPSAKTPAPSKREFTTALTCVAVRLIDGNPMVVSHFATFLLLKDWDSTEERANDSRLKCFAGCLVKSAKTADGRILPFEQSSKHVDAFLFYQKSAKNDASGAFGSFILNQDLRSAKTHSFMTQWLKDTMTIKASQTLRRLAEAYKRRDDLNS